MGPRRERGLWSFLTWSFFISQLAAGNAFASGAAQAASGTGDAGATAGAAHSGATGAGVLGTPDFRVEAASEPNADPLQNGAMQGHSELVNAGMKAGGIEQLDFTIDAGLDLQSMTSPAMLESVAPIADDDSPPAVSPGELPGEQPGVLPPVLETVDDLVDGLGSTLDDLLVPVVETVEDLAGVMGPALGQLLSPVGDLTNGLTDALGAALDPAIAPVASLAEGLGDFLEPVGGIGGQMIELADPILDLVEPVLVPVANIADAAQPILEPIVDLAAPVVGLVEPVIEPLLQPLAPITEPVLEILPLNIGNGGIFANLFDGQGGTDAVGSPGGIAFAAEAPAGGYELIEAGAYTELGITLHESPLPAAGGIGDLAGDVADTIGALVGDGDDGGPALPTLLGNLQQEIALRGLGEGLI